jgi:PilZ domain
MQDRRQSAREKVLFGGVAEISEGGPAMDCVVRNFSDAGACVEFNSSRDVPDAMNLAIARKGRSYLATLIWREANRVGLALRAMVTDPPPESDLGERLRRSEQKKRQLEKRIKELLGDS